MFDESRRKFLRYLVWGGVVGGLLFCDKNNNWIFLQEKSPERIEYLSSLSVEEIEKYPKLGSETLIEVVDSNLEEIIEQFLERIIKKYDIGEGKFSIIPTTQYYIVPDHRKFTNSLKQYCEKAVEFLYNKVSGLDLRFKDIEWVQINNHKNDYEGVEEVSGKGFLGEGFFEVKRFLIVYDEQRRFRGSIVSYNIGAFQKSLYNLLDKKFKWWYIFIPTNKNGLLGPFSEVIPFSITSKTMEYAEKVGIRKALEAGETLSEAMGYVLAKEMVSKFGLSDGEKYLSKDEYEFRGREYKYVAVAIEWIEKYGLQHAIDLYMEDPGKFMESVLKSKKI